jgi:hypothetical protein
MAQTRPTHITCVKNSQVQGHKSLRNHFFRSTLPAKYDQFNIKDIVLSID